MVDLPIALGASVAALVLLFSLARAIYYPFWAAGASRGAACRTVCRSSDVSSSTRKLAAQGRSAPSTAHLAVPSLRANASLILGTDYPENEDGRGT